MRRGTSGRSALLLSGLALATAIALDVLVPSRDLETLSLVDVLADAGNLPVAAATFTDPRGRTTTIARIDGVWRSLGDDRAPADPRPLLAAVEVLRRERGAAQPRAAEAASDAIRLRLHGPQFRGPADPQALADLDLLGAAGPGHCRLRRHGEDVVLRFDTDFVTAIAEAADREGGFLDRTLLSSAARGISPNLSRLEYRSRLRRDLDLWWERRLPTPGTDPGEPALRYRLRAGGVEEAADATRAAALFDSWSRATFDRFVPGPFEGLATGHVVLHGVDQETTELDLDESDPRIVKVRNPLIEGTLELDRETFEALLPDPLVLEATGSAADDGGR